LLIVLMAWTPFQLAYAGVISTDQAIGSAQADRAAVLSLVQRSDVQNQLQTLGVDPSTAKDRVAAMTDEEVRSLNNQLPALPAGADGAGWALVIIAAVLIWYFFFR
jgi:hypothetical protein